MKICYVGDALSIHTQRWAEAFSRRGHEVHVISDKVANLSCVHMHLLKSPNGTTSSIPNDPEPHPLWRTILWNSIRSISSINGLFDRKITQLCNHYSWVKGDLSIAKQVKEAIKVIRPDILHGHFLTRYAYYAARTGHSPLVVSPWGSDVFVNSENNFIGRRYCKFVIKRASGITAESKTMVKALQNLGAPKSKICHFSWGVDCDVFKPNLSKEASELKTKLRIPSDAPVIISNRTMSPLYNTHVIINSFYLVLQRIPNAILLLLRGHGTDEYISKISEDSNNLGISHSVRFVDHLLTPQEMAITLNASDILLSIPSSDSFPISVLEGMACGVMPTLSNIQANQELKETGANVIIVPSTDEHRIASAIVSFLKGSHDIERTICRNQKYVIKNHNWQESVKSMSDVYDGVLKRH